MDGAVEGGGGGVEGVGRMGGDGSGVDGSGCIGGAGDGGRFNRAVMVTRQQVCVLQVLLVRRNVCFSF